VRFGGSLALSRFGSLVRVIARSRPWYLARAVALRVARLLAQSRFIGVDAEALRALVVLPGLRRIDCCSRTRCPGRA
jgi:hypothetical protein